MTDVEFMVKKETPPPLKAGARGVWKQRLTPLLDDPGEWYKIATGPWRRIERMRYSLVNGRYSLPEGDWEFRMVSGEGREKGELYAKYVGPHVDRDTTDADSE